MDYPTPAPKPPWRYRLLEMAAIAALAVAASTCLVLALSAPADAQTPVAPRLKAVIVIDGSAITLGDAFTQAGARAAAIIAPAPEEGATQQFSADYLIAAARAAGLANAEAGGITRATVTRRRAPASGLAPSRAVPNSPFQQTAEKMIRKGETVMVRVEGPGFRLALQGRALSDAGEGEPVRILNLQSSRTIDAIATGPGLAASGLTSRQG